MKMKFVKILAAGLAMLMMMFCFVACDNGGDGDSEGTSDSSNSANVTLNVSIKVIDVNGETVYSTDKYTYIGKSASLISVLDDYLYIDEEIEAKYDEYKTLLGIGSIEVGEVTGTAENGDTVVQYYTYWWYRVNGRDGSKSMAEYEVQDGDAIEIYVNKKNAE